MATATNVALHNRSTWKFCMAVSISTPSPRVTPYHSPSRAPSMAAGAATLSASRNAGTADGTDRRSSRSRRPAPSEPSTSWLASDDDRNPDTTATKVVKIHGHGGEDHGDVRAQGRRLDERPEGDHRDGVDDHREPVHPGVEHRHHHHEAGREDGDGDADDVAGRRSRERRRRGATQRFAILDHRRPDVGERRHRTSEPALARGHLPGDGEQHDADGRPGEITPAPSGHGGVVTTSAASTAEGTSSEVSGSGAVSRASVSSSISRWYVSRWLIRALRGRSNGTVRTSRTCTGAAGHHHHAVGEQHGLLHRVGHEQRRHPLALDDARQLEVQPAAGHRIEGTERLVQQ